MGAFKNGPRLWTLDWLEVMAGKERDFNGLKARWVTWLHVPKEMRKHEAVAYKVIGVKRDTQFGIDAGSPAFLLDDPEGNSWCMKSASLIVDPNQTYESLKDLGQPPEARGGLELPDRRARPGPRPHAGRRGRPDHAGRAGEHLRPGRWRVQQLQAVRRADDDLGDPRVARGSAVALCPRDLGARLPVPKPHGSVRRYPCAGPPARQAAVDARSRGLGLRRLRVARQPRRVERGSGPGRRRVAA